MKTAQLYFQSDRGSSSPAALEIRSLLLNPPAGKRRASWLLYRIGYRSPRATRKSSRNALREGRGWWKTCRVCSPRNFASAQERLLHRADPLERRGFISCLDGER